MMKYLRESIKQLRTIAACYSGIAWISLAVAFKRRIAVLMYHRVLPLYPASDTFSSETIVVSPRTFDLQMRFLRRFCNPVNINQFQRMMRGELAIPPRACLVTFDDGWFDNAEYALPILERYKIPAVVFVASSYLDTPQTFWQEQTTRLLFEAWRAGDRAHEIFDELNGSHVVSQREVLARTAIRDLVTSMKTWDRPRLDAFVTRTHRWLSALDIKVHNNGADRFMTWSQANALRASGLVAVESHGRSHTPLTSMDFSATLQELRGSREDLQARLNHDSRFFAYPNGNHNDQVAALVHEAGYTLAFTTVSGHVSPGDDVYRLKRINVSEIGTNSMPGFLCRVLGWW